MLDIMLILSPSEERIFTTWAPKSNSKLKHVAQTISKIAAESCWFWTYQQGHTSIFFFFLFNHPVGAKSCERTGQVLGNLTNMIPSQLHPTAETQRMTYTRIRWLFCVLRFQAPQPLLQWHWHSSHSHRQRRQFALHFASSPITILDGSLCKCKSYSVSKHKSEINYNTAFWFFFFLYCNQKTVYHFIKIVNTGYCTSKIPSRSLKKVPVRKRYGWVVGAPSALCRRSVFSSPWLHKMWLL